MSEGKKHRAAVIGLTGGIASGKTTVVTEFIKKGASVIDADKISHRIMIPGSASWKKVIAAFGPAIVNPDHTLNRKALAGIVFRNAQKRKLLERIPHPAIIAQIHKELRTLLRSRTPPKLILIDAPLLYEARMADMMDKVVVVWAPKYQQIRRLRERDGLAMKDAVARIDAQWPLNKKRSLAQYTIYNSRSKELTRVQINKLWEVLTKVP